VIDKLLACPLGKTMFLAKIEDLLNRFFMDKTRDVM